MRGGHGGGWLKVAAGRTGVGIDETCRIDRGADAGRQELILSIMPVCSPDPGSLLTPLDRAHRSIFSSARLLCARRRLRGGLDGCKVVADGARGLVAVVRAAEMAVLAERVHGHDLC